MIIGIDIRPLMDKEPSGVSLLLLNLLDNLFKVDRQNQYKLFYNSFHSVKDQLPKWDYPNVKFYGFRKPNKFLTASFLFFSRPYVDEMIGGCDLFIIPNLCFISLSKKCKQAVIVHDLSFELYREFFTNKWRLSYWLNKAKNTFLQADRLIVVSENTKTDLIKEYGVDSDKVVVINPGVDTLNLLVNSNLDEFNLPEKFILTLGTREPRKNLLGILQAYERLRNLGMQTGLVIAGGGGWLNKQVNNFIVHSKYRKDIKVLGYVEESVKNLLYQRADIFLYPSFYEGFGFPPLEAMKHKCPVISGANSSMTEICGECAVLADAYNINQLVAAIQQIESWSSEFKEQRLQEAHKHVSKFEWNKSVEGLQNLIGSL